MRFFSAQAVAAATSRRPHARIAAPKTSFRSARSRSVAARRKAASGASSAQERKSASFRSRSRGPLSFSISARPIENGSSESESNNCFSAQRRCSVLGKLAALTSASCDHRSWRAFALGEVAAFAAGSATGFGVEVGETGGAGLTRAGCTFGVAGKMVGVEPRQKFMGIRPAPRRRDSFRGTGLSRGRQTEHPFFCGFEIALRPNSPLGDLRTLYTDCPGPARRWLEGPCPRDAVLRQRAEPQFQRNCLIVSSWQSPDPASRSSFHCSIVDRFSGCRRGRRHRRFLWELEWRNNCRGGTKQLVSLRPLLCGLAPMP